MWARPALGTNLARSQRSQLNNEVKVMFKKPYRPMSALILAGVLSILAASAAQAGGGAGVNPSHQSAGDHNG